MALEPVRIKARPLKPHKSVHAARFESRSVLTNNPFNYVDLWLRREHQDDALFYWRQAREFYHSARGLSLQSSPLVLYYCFMNAAKALLSAKGVAFSEHHGVAAYNMRGPHSKIVLSNEGIRIRQNGIAPSLSTFLSDTETATTHSLEDVLYNIVCIHRTFCLSHPRSRELFLPLQTPEFVRDSDTGEVRLRALAVSDVDWRSFRSVLPASFQALPDGGAGVLSVDSVAWATYSDPTDSEIDLLRNLNRDLRTDLHYINAANTFWYLKMDGTRRIDRQPMTLTLVAMHRLSEICRYRPSELLSFLNGQKNWLLSEFVEMAPSQYLDEIACEMTGEQLMIPNVRFPA